MSFSADKPEFKEGLKFIRKLYREGLIDIAGLTQDKAQIKPLVDGAVVRVGMVASHHPGNFSSVGDDLKLPMHQYEALPPIRGPKGMRSTPWIIDQVVQPGQFVITDKCRNPVVAFRWADAFFYLGTALKEKGDEGLHWVKVSPGENLTGLNGKPATHFSLVLQLRASVVEAGPKQIQVNLIDDDGIDVIKPIERQFTIPKAEHAGPSIGRFVMEFGSVEFKKYGDYSIRVLIENMEMASIAFRVGQSPAGAQPKPTQL